MIESFGNYLPLFGIIWYVFSITQSSIEFVTRWQEFSAAAPAQCTWNLGDLAFFSTINQMLIIVGVQALYAVRIWKR
ncbi:hypothetical protein IW262DRAFT_1386050 [Armillaria fumosa]|nr:hypothetical protein IW262DRAFT_1386050 [Armillaria fumosa]